MGGMKMRLVALLRNKYFEISMGAFNKIEKLMSNYLIGLIIQMIAIFSLASLGLSILGIKYAITIAVFAALANIVPYLGPILGATFGILVGITVGTDLTSANDYLLLVLKIVAVFTAVQVNDNLIIQPLIFSKSVKAHPLEIFISMCNYIFASSIALTPCPIRSTFKSLIADQIDSGPATSPACATQWKPRLLASIKTSLNK